MYILFILCTRFIESKKWRIRRDYKPYAFSGIRTWRKI